MARWSWLGAWDAQVGVNERRQRTHPVVDETKRPLPNWDFPVSFFSLAAAKEEEDPHQAQAHTVIDGTKSPLTNLDYPVSFFFAGGCRGGSTSGSSSGLSSSAAAGLNQIGADQPGMS